MRRPFLFLIPLVSFISFGCSFLTPGLDTRTATEQKSKTVWDDKDSLWIDQSTTHNQRTAAVEGDSVTMEFYPDGTPKSITGATHALSQCSEPKDVASAYAHLADKNAEVAGKLTDMMTTIIPQLLPLFARGAPQASTAGGGITDRIREALAGVDPAVVEGALAGRGIDPAVVQFVLDTLRVQRPTTQPR